MDEGKKYVVYGMRLKCNQGSMENYLSTVMGHGVVYQGQPVMNANDHQKGIHLTHFGDCSSKAVFEEAKKEADEKYKAEEGDGFFTKAAKGIAKGVTKIGIGIKANFMTNKCELVTPLPWLFTSEDHTIDGAPALMMESLCPCALGGVISIVPVVEEVAQEAAQEEAIEEKVKTKEQQNKEDFLNQLPEKLKSIINISALKATDDGFVMCTESLDNAMNKLGLTDTDAYDDYHLYGVKDDNGNFTFSLLAMREKDDGLGISIPFISFDINTLADAAPDNMDMLANNISKTVSAKEQSRDENLYEYFEKAESKAPYLIADHYVDMVAQQSVDGKITLPDSLKNASERVFNALDEINKEADTIIYDSENNCLHIGDINDLSSVERRAILLTHTGNVNFNSFAAEVQYHSDKLNNVLAIVPQYKESVIRADMSVLSGDAENSFPRNLFDPYYDLNDSIVKEQGKIHGQR